MCLASSIRRTQKLSRYRVDDTPSPVACSLVKERSNVLSKLDLIDLKEIGDLQALP